MDAERKRRGEPGTSHSSSNDHSPHIPSVTEEIIADYQKSSKELEDFIQALIEEFDGEEIF